MRRPDLCMRVLFCMWCAHGWLLARRSGVSAALGVPRLTSSSCRAIFVVAVWLIIGGRDPQGVSGMFGFWMRVCVAYAAA